MTEKKHLASLTINEKLFLARRICVWCEHQLDRPGCDAIYPETRKACTEQVRIERRKNTLKNYKPRGCHETT